MSSWGLLIACQGLVLDGPAGVIGFRPRWQPEDHRSFFTAPEGWGLFIQERTATAQTEEIQVRHGRLSVGELVFETSRAPRRRAAITVNGKAVSGSVTVEGNEVRVKLPRRAIVEEGQALRVVLS